MSFISQYISEQLMGTLGWTLIHSIWQGALVALAFGLLMVFMRRQSARARYTAGVIALLVMLVISTVTFITLYNTGFTGLDAAALAALQDGKFADETGFLATFKQYFNRHLPLVVSLWFLGILVLTLRLTGGVLYNQRLKHHRVAAAPAPWRRRFEILGKKMKLNKAVELKESTLAKIPMTIGHFKPVILLPAQLLTGMPQDQLEALIAHEIAHIVRKDYLWNILQNMVEIVFFFHPGVRWISSHIRYEREVCCDDMAVSVSGNSVDFARALTHLQEVGAEVPAYAMAAVGRPPRLLNRVKRLVDARPGGSELSGRFAGLGVLVVCLFALVITTNAATAANGEPKQDDVKKQEEKRKQEEKQKQEQLLKLEQKRKQAELTDRRHAEEIAKKEAAKADEYKKLVTYYKELKAREGKLTEKEKDKLTKLKTLLKERSVELKKMQAAKQSAVAEREKQRQKEEELIKMHLKYKSLKKNEARLTDQERKKMELLGQKLKERQILLKKKTMDRDKIREKELQKKEDELRKMMYKLKAMEKKEAELTGEEKKKLARFREDIKKVKAALSAKKAEQKRKQAADEQMILKRKYKSLMKKAESASGDEKKKLEQLAQKYKQKAMQWERKQKEDNLKKLSIIYSALKKREQSKGLSDEEKMKIKKIAEEIQIRKQELAKSKNH